MLLSSPDISATEGRLVVTEASGREPENGQNWMRRVYNLEVDQYPKTYVAYIRYFTLKKTAWMLNNEGMAHKFGVARKDTCFSILSYMNVPPKRFWNKK